MSDPTAPPVEATRARAFPPPPVVTRTEQPPSQPARPAPATAMPPSIDDEPVPTMEEVLDAPSPRRAARELAERGAAAAVRQEGTTQDTGTEGSSAPESITQGSSSPESSTQGQPDAASTIDSLFGGAVDDDGSVTRAESGRLMDAPVTEWAKSLRSASDRAESARHDAAHSTPEASTAVESRSPMSTVQKALFWAIGIVIVVALVLLIVLLTTQDAGAAAPSAQQVRAALVAAAQPTSTS